MSWQTSGDSPADPGRTATSSELVFLRGCKWTIRASCESVFVGVRFQSSQDSLHHQCAINSIALQYLVDQVAAVRVLLLVFCTRTR